MNDKVCTNTKPHVISVRMSDEELQNLVMLMEMTNKKASDLLREAFLLLTSQFPTPEGAGK